MCNLRSVSLAIILALFASMVVADDAPQALYGIPADRQGTLWLGPAALDPARAGIGKTIPDLAFDTIGGETVNLYTGAGRLGTLVLVRDSECPVSKRYGPRIAQLARRFADAGFAFVFIYPNEALSNKQLQEDAAALGVPGIYAARGSFALAQALGVESTGDAFLLDAAHRLRYRGAVDDQYGLGYTKDMPTRNYLRNALDALREDRPVPVPATSAPGCYIDADPDKDQLFAPNTRGELLS